LRVRRHLCGCSRRDVILRYDRPSTSPKFFHAFDELGVFFDGPRVASGSHHEVLLCRVQE
jgi:hypothetical protein